MKLLLAFATSVALLAAAPYAANAGEQTVIRDSGGRTIGTATSSGNQPTFRFNSQRGLNWSSTPRLAR